MALAIRLIGRPSVAASGAAREIPGHKPWGLLAYLLLAPAAPTRRGVSELLWSDAEDPLAALRWSLHQVRRGIGPDANVTERDGRLSLELGDVSIDAHLVLRGDLTPEQVEAIGQGELLEGLFFDDAPAFEQWLTLERQRVGSALRDALRWAATTLARSQPSRALRLIQRVIALDPTDDAVHELAVDIHVSRGDRAGAERYLDSIARTYRAELGIEPPTAIRRPLERPRPSGSDLAMPPAITAQALLDLATGRLESGEYAAAEDAARRAAGAAAAADDRTLEARALATLGSVLVHSVRGRDREAVGLLTRSFQLASEMRDVALASEAAREIGYIAFLAADYGSAEASLRRAVALADQAGTDVQRGQALTYIGGCEIDRGDLDRAEGTLRDALASLDRAGERRFRWFTLSFLARALLRKGELPDAERLSREAIEGARAAGWRSVTPWMQVHLGEAQLAQGRIDEAERTFAEAFAVSAEIADPCWEGLSLRGMALVEVRRGKPDRARTLLADAHQRCTRVPDTLWWADAAILTDLVELEDGRDQRVVENAFRLVRRGPMPDLAARLFRYVSQTPPQTPR
ncbi:MAG TPA: tetratricopeptide repeat protein [Candidatus Limnocylindria bacterium]